MAEIVTFKMHGWDELQKKLQEELPKDARLALRMALNAGAGDIKRAAEDAAPQEAEGSDAGFLKKHIKTKTTLRRNDLAGSAKIGPTNDLYPGREGKQGKVHFTTAGGKKVTFQSNHAGGVTAAQVGRYLEFGTKHITARGWLSKAWERTKNVALAHVIAKLKAGLKLS